MKWLYHRENRTHMNCQLAAKRLQGLHRRLHQDPTVLWEYDKIIQDQVMKGIVLTVEPSSHESGQKLRYLLHHAVVRRSKETTKVRIIYDTSARSTGPSLNDCLYVHVGPCYSSGCTRFPSWLILRKPFLWFPLLSKIEMCCDFSGLTTRSLTNQLRLSYVLHVTSLESHLVHSFLMLWSSTT